ncbi:MAG: hypothetical protein AAF704_17665, partial [Cyanobacteria bacterium P01_D01_bin.123]
MNDPAPVQSRHVDSARRLWWPTGLLEGWRRCLSLMLVLVWCALGACSEAPVLEDELPTLAVTATPPELAKLGTYLDGYEPRVSIVSPKPDEVVSSSRVSVKFAVEGYPLFKDPDLGLGPHLHVILDNEPYRALYDAAAPMVFEDLAPGTHTIRAFASRPWHESFKNASAYASVTFHVKAKTPEYSPQPELPVLTYSRPKGKYGAEPVLLDVWLA